MKRKMEAIYGEVKRVIAQEVKSEIEQIKMTPDVLHLVRDKFGK